MQIQNDGQTQSPAEEMGFQLHPNLLRHIIGRQAPSLAKAVLEVAMNAVDGGASKLILDLSETGLVALDDGRGFGTDPDEIKRVFGTFGEPHAEEDVPLGEFRMGRGQLFAQGKTTYESGAFRFDVDLRGRGQSWRLETGQPYQPGCRITVEFPQPREIEPSTEEIKELVAWLPIAIHLNGEEISQPPASAEWDMETDDAWFKMGQGPLKVYNRGAFVHAYPAETWGIGGVVVSKARLAVTFGRNEVMRDCAVFKRIVANLDDLFLAGLRARKTKSMPAQMRARALKMLSTGKLRVDDLAQFWVLRDARGRSQSLQVLTRFSAVAMGPLGDPHAFRAIETGKALVLDEEYFEGSGVNLARLLAVMKRDGYPAPALLSWEQILADIKLGRNSLPEQDLPPHERALLFGAQAASRAVAALIEEMDLAGGVVPTRRVIAAARDSEDAFSDGESFIALNLRHLEALSKGEFSFVKAAALLASAYIRFPAPGVGDNIEEDTLEAALRESVVAGGVFHLVSTHIDPVSVSRSPLSGDPMVISRWWNKKVSVRDLGDVARLWAEDYGRRCAGFGILPKMTLLMAAGAVGVADVVAEQSDDPVTWWDNVVQILVPLLRYWGLGHWKVDFADGRLSAVRGKPARAKYESADSHTRDHRLGFLGDSRGFGRSDYRNVDIAAWAAEKISTPPSGLPPLLFNIKSKKKLKPIEEMAREIWRCTIKAELHLGGLDAYAHKEVSPSMWEALTAYAPSYKDRPRYRTEHGRRVEYEKLPSFHPCAVDATIQVFGKDLVISLSASCGPEDPNYWYRRTGPSQHAAFHLHAFVLEWAGWPRVVRIMRRRVLSMAGERHLLKVTRQQLLKDKAKDDPHGGGEPEISVDFRREFIDGDLLEEPGDEE